MLEFILLEFIIWKCSNCACAKARDKISSKNHMLKGVASIIPKNNQLLSLDDIYITMMVGRRGDSFNNLPFEGWLVQMDCKLQSIFWLKTPSQLPARSKGSQSDSRLDISKCSKGEKIGYIFTQQGGKTAQDVSRQSEIHCHWMQKMYA